MWIHMSRYPKVFDLCKNVGRVSISLFYTGYGVFGRYTKGPGWVGYLCDGILRLKTDVSNKKKQNSEVY